MRKFAVALKSEILCRASSSQRSRSRATFVIFPATTRHAPSKNRQMFILHLGARLGLPAILAYELIIRAMKTTFSVIALKLAFHTSLVSVSFDRKRIDMSGLSAEYSGPEKVAATTAANSSFRNSIFMRLTIER